MESQQVDRRLEWLDEQHRKDAETIGRLEKRLAALEGDLAKQARQLQEAAAEATRLAALAVRINQFDDSLAKHRQEVARVLEDAEDRRTEKEKQLTQARKRDQTEVSKALSGLKAELGTLDDVRQAIDARREEEMRLSRTMDALDKAVEDLKSKDEERARSVVSQEDGRKQDLKRLAELQTEVSALRQRFDTARSTLDTVDDRVRRVEIRLSDVSGGENERRESLSLWMEQQNLRMVDFDRSAKEWGKRFEVFEKMAKELDERVLAYEEIYRALKQQREELDALMQRLERRITEVGEMQRLTEDRLKTEWATFQADDQKRWNTYKLARDELWRDHNRLHERIGKQLQSLDEGLAAALRNLTELGEAEQQRLLALLSMVRDWASDVERQTEQVR
jgi:chromosome segregation ATPase